MTTISAFLIAADVTDNFSSAQLIQLLDDPVNPTGALNTTLRDKIIARVNGEASSLTSGKLIFPLQVDDSDADNIKATLAGFVQDGYNRAIQWLEAVRDSKATIGTSKTIPGAEARNAAVETSPHKGTFERKRMRGW